MIALFIKEKIRCESWDEDGYLAAKQLIKRIPAFCFITRQFATAPNV